MNIFTISGPNGVGGYNNIIRLQSGAVENRKNSAGYRVNYERIFNLVLAAYEKM